MKNVMAKTHLQHSHQQMYQLTQLTVEETIVDDSIWICHSSKNELSKSLFEETVPGNSAFLVCLDNEMHPRNSTWQWENPRYGHGSRPWRPPKGPKEERNELVLAWPHDRTSFSNDQIPVLVAVPAIFMQTFLMGKISCHILMTNLGEILRAKPPEMDKSTPRPKRKGHPKN